MTTPATVTARYLHRGDRLSLRGDTLPLSWSTDTPPDAVQGDRHTWHIAVPANATVEIKLVRDGAWAFGRNVVLGGGDHVELRPAFDRHQGVLEKPIELETDPGRIRARVFLPPSYHEQSDARFSVIYAQDGQSLWSDSQDPFGAWSLDRVLDQLWALGAVQELIVVSIDTSENRVPRLTPVRDARFGGGEAEQHLHAMTQVIKPWADRTFRTRPGRESTALLGSSIGGLFSLWAAWTRPKTFGAAMCLSSSFWWSDRFAVKLVQRPVCPSPKPLLYLDSGAARSPFEVDANVRDGRHHTHAVQRALIEHCYQPGHDLHVLTFVGEGHAAGAWAARVAVPLQLVFPERRAGT